MRKRSMGILLALVLPAVFVLSGCGSGSGILSGKSDVIEIEMIQSKQEAVDIFAQFEEDFNASHDDIHLTIISPNDATTILKTRFIREDYPDIIGIGGDINYSYFLDSEILADISDYQGLDQVKSSYNDILENLEFVPTDGIYAVPYMANAAGILYNKDMFDENGWEIPTTWDELITLCENIQSAGILPFYFGFKDSWTCLSPWNALAVDLAPADVCQQVNRGETTFSDEYGEIAEKILLLQQYGESGAVAYGYNDACTAFANGEAAMFVIGSYAVPQVLSVNPDMNIDSFVMPGSNNTEDNVLNSGIDVMFCVTDACEHKEAAYEVLDFFLEHENAQMYIDDQNAVPCLTGDYDLAEMLDGMSYYIEEGIVCDYQDHYYPSEMSVDAQVQTLLLEQDVDAFLEKFDTDWQRYNRDIIKLVEDYEAKHSNE